MSDYGIELGWYLYKNGALNQHITIMSCPPVLIRVFRTTPKYVHYITYFYHNIYNYNLDTGDYYNDATDEELCDFNLFINQEDGINGFEKEKMNEDKILESYAFDGYCVYPLTEEYKINVGFISASPNEEIIIEYSNDPYGMVGIVHNETDAYMD